MFYNNNSEGILKLSKSIYRKNKTRNLMVILAIILTTILVTTNFRSILVVNEIDKNYGKYKDVSRISKSLDLEWSDMKIEGIGQYFITNYNPNIEEELDREVYLLPETFEGLENILKGKEISGRLPKNEEEIIIPSWLMSSLDRNNPNPKIYVNLSSKKSEAQNEEYKRETRIFDVVGNYKEEKPSKEDYGRIYYYPKTTDGNIYVALVMFLLITLASGYLLINNIFHIAVIKDSKLFALLKTIGLTSKGIKKVLYYGALLNLLIGIPIGLLLGTIISEGLMPIMFKISKIEVDSYSVNNSLVALLTTIFIVCTVYFCIDKPKKHAEKISPMEACRTTYYEKDGLALIRGSSHSDILNRIAIFNIFSNKRKLFSTIGSISISGITLIVSICFYFSFKPTEFIEKSYKHDYGITINDSREAKGYSDSFLKELKGLNEIEIVKEVRYDGENVKNNTKTFIFDLKEGANKENFERKIRIMIQDENNPQIRIDSKYRELENAMSVRSGIFTIGMVISFLIGLIGFISSLNTMLTSIFTRNLEFALFESVGMTKLQQKKMLIEEGNYFTLYGSLMIIPTSFIVTIYGSTAFSDYQGFSLIIYLIALIFTLVVIYLILSIIPIICYRYLKNKSVVDRIRASEY